MSKYISLRCDKCKETLVVTNPKGEKERHEFKTARDKFVDKHNSTCYDTEGEDDMDTPLREGTRAAIDKVVNETISKVYQERPTLARLKGAERNKLQTLIMHTMYEKGYESLQALAQVASKQDDSVEAIYGIKVTLKAQTDELAGFVLDTWDKYLALSFASGESLHTLARAYVYTNSPEATYQEQGGYIMNTLEAMERANESS